MGEIRKVLAMGELEPRTITAGQIWTDLCEDVHLHFRNTRFDFSEEEWAHFRAAINQLGMAVEMVAAENDYREGDPNFLIQQIYNTPVKTDSKYYPNRATLELQRDNTVHFHYRDLRVHWTSTEFRQIAQMFVDALDELKNLKPFPFSVSEPTRIDGVPIDLIQPYDAGHRPLDIDKEHRDGIEHVKALIKAGKKIRPILVNCEGQRMDGFKRYMAQKELGCETIDIIVDPFAFMGGQNNQGLEDDESDIRQGGDEESSGD